MRGGVEGRGLPSGHDRDPATKLQGKTRKVYPCEVVLPFGFITPAHESIIMPQQIRTISKMRLLEKIGQLNEPAQQRTIETRLLEHLGILFEAEALEDY